MDFINVPIGRFGRCSAVSTSHRFNAADRATRIPVRGGIATVAAAQAVEHVDPVRCVVGRAMHARAGVTTPRALASGRGNGTLA
jgi:hypothetical protein